MTEVIVPLTQVFVSPEEVDEAGWQDQALCAQTDPEAFFPEKGGSHGYLPGKSAWTTRTAPPLRSRRNKDTQPGLTQ